MRVAIIVILGVASACRPNPSSMPTAPTGLAAGPSAPLQSAAAVEVAVLPDPVVIEKVRGAQRVSCDFRIRNPGTAAQTLRAITVVAFDAQGVMLARRLIDFHGIAPGIEVIPTRVIEPGKTVFVFNPIDMFADDLALANLRFELGFVDAAGATSAVALGVALHGFTPAARLEVPLDGNVLVAHGHGFTDPHRRIDLDHPFVRSFGLRANSGRYALDLAIVDDQGRMFEGEGGRLEQWKGYRAQVRAPAAGSVIGVIDGVPDNRLTAAGIEFTVDPTQRTTLFGNLVAIEHAGGEVSLFAHLRAGSLRVKPGDRVAAGAPLGEIGFSGNLDFVHTHFQVMRRATSSAASQAASQAAIDVALESEGIPIYFHDFERLTGSRAVATPVGAVDTGDIVRRRR